MQSYQEARPMQQSAPPHGISPLDWFAPLMSAGIAGASTIGAQILNGLGLLPPLAADVVSTTAFAVIAGAVSALPVLLGFWLKYRRQTVENLSLEELLNQAQQEAMAAGWSRLQKAFEDQLERAYTDINRLRAIVDGQLLSLSERDSIIIEKDRLLLETGNKLQLLTGILADKHSGGTP